MHKLNSMRPTRRKAVSCVPDLFDWQQGRDLLSTPSIRTMARKANVSPAVAAVIADLCGFSREIRS